MVPEYCTCGAKLPPDARFCHKCAKPQYDYPGTEDAQAISDPAPLQGPPPLPVALPTAPAAAEISFRNRTAVKIGFFAALLAVGATLLVTAVTQSSILGLIVFFGAGVIGPPWYRRRTGQRLSVRSGARIGWITGIFCFAFFLVLLTISVLAITNANSIPALRDNPNMKNPAVQDWLKTLSDPAKATESIIMFVVTMFLFVTTLPMLGGALGARLSDKRL